MSQATALGGAHLQRRVLGGTLKAEDARAWPPRRRSRRRSTHGSGNFVVKVRV